MVLPSARSNRAFALPLLSWGPARHTTVRRSRESDMMTPFVLWNDEVFDG